jgi:hypothetical protein
MIFDATRYGGTARNILVKFDQLSEDPNLHTDHGGALYKWPASSASATMN